MPIVAVAAAAPEWFFFGILVFFGFGTIISAGAAIVMDDNVAVAQLSESASPWKEQMNEHEQYDRRRFLTMDHSGQSGSDYVRGDTSGEFSALAKCIVFFVWFFPLAVSRITMPRLRKNSSSSSSSSSSLSHHRAILYLGASLLMVECRAWLYANMVKTEEAQETHHHHHQQQHPDPRSFDGPAYNVLRAVPWEPVLMLWASLVWQACLKRTTTSPTTTPTTPTFTRRQLPHNDYHRYLLLLWTAVQSALWIQQNDHEYNEDDGETDDWMSIMARTLGSTLTLSGSVANTLMAVLSYDIITYASLTRDLAVPVTLALVALMPLSAMDRRGANGMNLQGYSSLDPSVELSSTSAHQENDYHDLELVVNSNPSSASIMQENAEASFPFSVSTNSTNDINTAGREQEENNIVDEISTSQHLADEQRWMHLSPSAKPEIFTCFLSLGMTVLYFADYNFLSVAVGAAFLALLYKSVVRQNDYDGLETHNVIGNLDYPTLLCYIGEFILVGSLIDTGLPQDSINAALGDCAGQIYGDSDNCIFRSTTVFGFVAATVSPQSAMLMAEATSTFGNPYQWTQLTWTVGIGGKCLSHPLRYRRQWFVAVLPFTLVTLYAGTWLIAVFHTSRACSVRLGECS